MAGILRPPQRSSPEASGPRHIPLRPWRSWGGEVCLLAAFTGCATVDPSADFQAAARSITERTGIDSVYDPEVDHLIAERITDFLRDGVTVEEAVRIALLNNPAFQQQFLEIGASRADVVQSELLTNPGFALSARFPEGGGRSDLTLGFGQELVDLWQIPVRRRIAEARLQQVVLTTVNEGTDLVAKVKTRCYAVLAVQQAQTITRQSLTLFERTLKLARDRFEAGETSLLDVNLAQADLVRVNLDLVNVQRDLRVAESELARALSLSRWGSSWGLRDALPAVRNLPEEDTAFLLHAMTTRVDARIAALEIQATQEELKREHLNVVPSVTLGVEAERLERRALPGRKILADTVRDSIAAGQLTAPTIQSKGERDLERRQIIDSLIGPTLEIKLPIWDQNQAQIAKAQVRVSQKRKQYENVLDQVAQEVEQASATGRAAAALVQLYEEKSLPLARENVESAKRAYEVGEQSILAVIEAQESLIEQQRAHLVAQRDFAIALAELERAVGGRLPDAPESQPGEDGAAKEPP